MIVAEVLMVIGLVCLVGLIGTVCYKLGKLLNRKETK